MRRPDAVGRLARLRQEARAEHDVAAADALTAQIEEAGWLVADTPTGYSLTPRPPYPVLPDLAALPDLTAGGSTVRGPASVGLLVQGRPGEVRRCLDALRRHLPAGVRVIGLDAGNVDGAGDVLHQLAADTGGRVEEWHLAAPVGWGPGTRALLRLGNEDVHVVLDPATVLTGDAVTPLLAALGDWGVVAAGAQGIGVAGGEVEALHGSPIAVRRAAALAADVPDAGALVRRNADLAMSIALRAYGGRLVVPDGELPVRQARHLGLPTVQEQSDVPLAGLTTLRLGGPARRLVVATDEDELVDAVRAVDAASEPLLVLGGGSNLVIADEGFAGTVVQVATSGIEVGSGGQVTAAAGEDWDAFVLRCVDEGRGGVEALSGIPGLVGATPIQNVGAYGQAVSETVTSVRVLDRRRGTVSAMSPDECYFTYRHSVFKGNDRFVVLAVTYRLGGDGSSSTVRYAELAGRLGVEVGDQVPLADVRAAVLDLRRAKGMVLDKDDHDTWSAGSFFTNPILPAADVPADAPRWPEADGRVKTSAAWLIERSGFAKGYGAGRVQVSTKHTLALTNRGGASTADLVALAREIRAGVRDRFGIELANEPVLVGCSI